MKKRLIKFRVVSLAMLTLLLSFLTSTAYAVDFTLQTNSSTFAKGETNSLVASQSGVTFTYLKGSSGDFANVPQSDHIRMYQGSTLTIESAASITNLKVTCTTSSYGPANITIDGNELSSGTWTGNAKNIVMTAKAQARITSIVVTLNDAEIPVKVPTITADTYFIGSTNVTLACETEGASIYYTTNGDAVTTENGTLYNGNPFPITATTTVKAIAVKDADTSFENEATFTAVDTKADLASVKDLAKGSLFGFTGDATVVANPDNTNVYIKDANSFSLIYDSKKATTLPVGSKIVPNWIAKTDVYNALVEIVPISELVAAEGEPAAVTYDEATFADVVEANVNKVVVFKNLEYTLGTGKNITFKEGEQTIAGYNKFSLTIDEPVEGKKYDVVGAISINNSTMQILPLSITRVPEVLPVNITAETGTNLTELVNAKKEEIINGGDLVGDITINLAANGAYTMSASIEAPAAISIVGDANAPATIDASALATPVISMSTTPTVELINNYYRVSTVKIANVKITGAKGSLFYDNSKAYCVVDFTIDNALISLASETTAISNEALISFKSGGIKDLTIKNSTVYGTAAPKYFVRYSNNARIDRYGYTEATDTWSMTYTNNTFYNVIPSGTSGQWGNYGGVASKAGQMILTIKDNIWYDCSSQVMRRLTQSKPFSSFNAASVMQNNTFWNSTTGKTDSQDNYGNGTDLVTNPTFVDASAGDFHVFCGSQQAKYKTGDPRWLVEYDAAQALAVPVVISPATDTDITTALNEAKQSIDNVGDITINLAANGSYTVSGSIEAPASLTIAGLDANAPATINASDLATPVISMSTTPTVELINNYYRVSTVKIANVKITGAKGSLFYDNSKAYCVVDFTIDNALISLASETTAISNEALISFKSGGIKDLTIKNSTVYGTAAPKYFVRYSNNARIDRYGYTEATDTWSMTYTNNTFYNVIPSGTSGQWGNYGGVASKAGQMILTIKDNIWYDCSSQVMRRLTQSKPFSSFNAASVMQNNTFWNSTTGKTDSQDNYGNGTDLVTNPTFVDASAGDFHVFCGSQQAKYKTGDPRWLSEFVPDDVTASKALLLAEIQNATTLLGDADVNTNADAKALKDAIDKAKGVYAPAALKQVLNAPVNEREAAEAAYIATSINEVNVNADAQSGEWFTTQGVRISKPTQKGIYIHNGKKIMINNK